MASGETGYPSLGKQITFAKKDLATRLNVPVDQITLISAEVVVWPDRGLGCPQPGMGYIQVQHDGLRIRLQVKDSIYHYHSGRNRPPFLCEHPAGG
jgi:hypothetical protein